MIKTSAIILAAGRSQRAGIDKQFYRLGDKYLIQHTIERFRSSQVINEIILVLSEENIKKYGDIFNGIKIAQGGKTRIESMLNGAKYISPQSDVVLVHDGARPFVSERIIKEVSEAAYRYGCAIPAIPINDTIKEIDRENSCVIKTINREKVFAVQTPQGYHIQNFKKLINQTDITDDLTDDSQLAEKMGMRIYVVEGEDTNIKITTPIDFIIAEVLYEKNKTKTTI